MVSSTSFTDTGYPNNGTTYYWCVYAGNNIGYGPQSQVKNFNNGVIGNRALPVEFITQVPPGNNNDTHNCGQTCALMTFCYWNKTTPTVQGIKDIDDWLYTRFNLPKNDYNGSDATKDQLAILAREYASFTASYAESGWDLNGIRREIKQGRPVIVAIIAGFLTNKTYNWNGGHFVLAVGYTDT